MTSEKTSFSPPRSGICIKNRPMQISPWRLRPAGLSGCINDYGNGRRFFSRKLKQGFWTPVRPPSSNTKIPLPSSTTPSNKSSLDTASWLHQSFPLPGQNRVKGVLKHRPRPLQKLHTKTGRLGKSHFSSTNSPSLKYDS